MSATRPYLNIAGEHLTQNYTTLKDTILGRRRTLPRAFWATLDTPLSELHEAPMFGSIVVIAQRAVATVLILLIALSNATYAKDDALHASHCIEAVSEISSVSVQMDHDNLSYGGDAQPEGTASTCVAHECVAAFHGKEALRDSLRLAAGRVTVQHDLPTAIWRPESLHRPPIA